MTASSASDTFITPSPSPTPPTSSNQQVSVGNAPPPISKLSNNSLEGPGSVSSSSSNSSQIPPDWYSLRNAASFPPPLLHPLNLSGVDEDSFASKAESRLKASKISRSHRSKVAANMGTFKILVAGDVAIGKVC